MATLFLSPGSAHRRTDEWFSVPRLFDISGIGSAIGLTLYGRHGHLLCLIRIAGSNRQIDLVNPPPNPTFGDRVDGYRSEDRP
jgi:hypothetical protein